MNGATPLPGAIFWADGSKTFDNRATYYVHLSWHQALFELAQGRYQSALQIYEDWIRPAVTAKTISAPGRQRLPAVAAANLWRYAPADALGRGEGAGRAPPPAVPARPSATPTPPLAFAASGDRAMMDTMLERLRADVEKGSIFAKEIILPMAQGIDAFAQEDYAGAVHFLEPVFPQLTRIGGSHAQREVFEDTLLEAYLRAGQFDRAEEMLRERLNRRETVRDPFWMDG